MQVHTLSKVVRLSKDYLNEVSKPVNDRLELKLLDTIDNFVAVTVLDMIIYDAPGTPYEYGTFDVHINVQKQS